MEHNNQTPIINSKLLILLLFINSLVRGFIQVNFKNNDAFRIKIMIIWLLTKMLVILLNVRRMKNYVYKLTHDQDVPTDFWGNFRNTHLVSCICTFMAFLMMKL